MKICIWCSLTECETVFKKKAHTIPKALGGKFICLNICDHCNSYFGSPQKDKLSIEASLKEGLNISRYRLLRHMHSKKTSQAGPFKSIYFKFFDVKDQLKLIPTHKYSKSNMFQDILTRKFKRGLYKMYLEELERQVGNALNSKYDFIRHFARYDLNHDLPVIHFERNVGVILTPVDWIVHPQIFLNHPEEYMLLQNQYGFTEFEVLGHVFGVATSKLWELNFEQYIAKSLEKKKGLYYGYRIVKTFDDLDLTLNRALKHPMYDKIPENINFDDDVLDK